VTSTPGLGDYVLPTPIHWGRFEELVASRWRAEDVATLTEHELLSCRNVGYVTIRELREALRAIGLDLAGSGSAGAAPAVTIPDEVRWRLDEERF
jgi:hypothetical protein